MNRPIRVLLTVAAVLFFLIVIAPLIVPLPPLSDIAPLEELADADSQFIQVNGLSLHYKKYGDGEPVIILLHGFGASTFSWREVIQPLSRHGTVIAYDRPAFGLTERPMPGSWQNVNPYSAEGNLNLLFGLMDALDVQKAILVGNSAGGRLAVQAALLQPERVSALVLVDAAIYTGGGRSFGILRPLVFTRQMDRLGPFFARSIAGEQGDEFLRAAWHDPGKITPEIMAGYRKPLRVDHWDRALWELTKVGSGSEDLGQRLSELSLPVLVITGDDDRIVPTADLIRLGNEIPGAKFVMLPGCGHVPHEECPAPFLQAVDEFFQSKTSQLD